MNNTENNRLLAEFLGWEEQKYPTERWFGHWFEPSGKHHIHLHFDTDWNWIMLVVDKIENLGFNVTIGAGEYCRIGESFATPDFDVEIEIEYDGSKLDCVYSACVAFVKEYNKQHKQ